MKKLRTGVEITEVRNDMAIEICCDSPYDEVKTYQEPKKSYVDDILFNLFNNDINPNND